MPKIALITGITGQDGAYLTRFLLGKGYVVHGIKRKSSLLDTPRLDPFFKDPQIDNSRLILHYGDLTDGISILRIIQKVQPDEIYNLAGMSHVKVSSDIPEYTADTNGTGVLRILEAVRLLGLEKKVRFYQASTSELFGLARETPQHEQTSFNPRNPYGVAKLYGYWITVNYREKYRMFACNGIAYNHESPLRGETFVTRKITRAVADIAFGVSDVLTLGNLNARRDWGHSADYVWAMWLMLQQDTPDDYIIASGISTTLRELLRMSFAGAGIEVEFTGEGMDEQGRIVNIEEDLFIARVGADYLPAMKKRLAPEHSIVMKVDPEYYAPVEEQTLVGDASKARNRLGWKPEYNLQSVIEEMVVHDLQISKNHLLCDRNQ